MDNAEGYLWSMYFATITGFQFHPGCKNPLELESCAEIADLMITLYKERYTCQSSQQSLAAPPSSAER